MLKALFLDMDETLCDTTGANLKALNQMAEKAAEIFAGQLDAHELSARYLKGIYRELDDRYRSLLLPVTDEEAFRLQLIELIVQDLGVTDMPADAPRLLQSTFDESRTAFFDFFAGMGDQLLQWRKQVKLIVITNGPEFSQVVKVERVDMSRYVDHIIIGGQEKEEKPAVSIFEKALKLAECEPEEVLHVGDSLSSDIMGANNAGIRALWVSHGESRTGHAAVPDYEVETPFEFIALVNDMLDS